MDASYFLNIEIGTGRENRRLIIFEFACSEEIQTLMDRKSIAEFFKISGENRFLMVVQLPSSQVLDQFLLGINVFKKYEDQLEIKVSEMRSETHKWQEKCTGKEPIGFNFFDIQYLPCKSFYEDLQRNYEYWDVVYYSEWKIIEENRLLIFLQKRDTPTAFLEMQKVVSVQSKAVITKEKVKEICLNKAWF